MASEMKSVAICGSGPAGMYVAYKLLKTCPKVHIDIFDRNKLPYGLMRYGVAPDHPEMKLPIQKFDQLFKDNKSNLRFFGNVDCAHLYERKFFKPYSHLVLAHGFAEPRRLGLANNLTLPALDLIKLYNNYGNESIKFTLPCKSLTVIGGGNVTLDLIRMFLKNLPDGNRKFATLKADVQEVNILIRGSVLPSKMTTSALREISKLENTNFNLLNFSGHDENCDRKNARFLSVFQEMSQSKGFERTVNWFFQSKLTGISRAGSKLQISTTNLPQDASFLFKPRHPGTILSDNVIESLGFLTKPLNKDIPFWFSAGAYSNVAGRIPISSNTAHYCAGWCKNGARGTIAETMVDSFRVAQQIAQDKVFQQSNWSEMSSETHLRSLTNDLFVL